MRLKSERKGGNRDTISVFVIFAFLCFSATAGATIVELDLLSLGCPTEFNFNQYWQTDFDLGVNFVEITNVYMDWSGSITAGLAINYANPNEPFPQEVGIGAALKKPPLWRYIILGGGETTYPNPEPFDCLSEFVKGDMPWSDLLDGRGTILIQYMEMIMLDGKYIEHGSISLDRATLVVEGTIVPEPATILLIGFGAILLRTGTHRISNNNRG